jgi:hypothetical protein
MRIPQRRVHRDVDESARSGTAFRRLPFRWLLFVVCALVVCLSTGLFLVARTAPQAHAATWTEVWGDEFNGPAGSPLDTSQWIYDIGTGYGTGEIETTTNSTANVSLDGNGHLAITPLRDANGNWTSGRIETVNDSFAAPPGGELEVTASLQQPNVSGNAALGYWPAFWMLGTPYRTDHNWPKDGEVDIMEDVNGLSSVFGTMHCGTYPGGPCNEPNGIGSGQRPCPGCQTGFHTYTVIIDRSVSPEQIRWYLDGNNYFTVSANQVDPTTWANAVDHAFYIIFDLAIGGGFPAAFGGGPTSATQPGVPMLIDYVRVYTANGSAVTPTATPTPSPTPTASGGSGSGFTQGVNAISSNQVQFWFQPSGWTAGYVILHYTIPGQAQQNVQMSYNSSAGQWQYTVSGVSSGQTITYSFTYQKSGLQYDTSTYTYTVGSSAATPTPTPTPSGGSGFSQGVNSVSATQAQFWFQPSGWTAGYVILHYTIPGQVQQNVQMSYNSSAGQWQYTAGGMSSGQTITYSFTYQQNGLQYDTSTYTWTHP